MNCLVNSSPASFSISVATDLMLKILENIMEVISLKKNLQISKCAFKFRIPIPHPETQLGASK